MARFGSVGTQYFDDAGDPLIGGKLYFYEPDTSTFKNTYADAGLTTENTNPVILTAAGRQPNIFFSGTAKAILTSADDVNIELRDPVGGDLTDSAFSDWNANTVYYSPDIVVGSDGKFYLSITDANSGNDPTSTPAEWSEIKFIRVWNTNENYPVDQVVQAGDGLLYTAVNAQSGNDPVGDAINWKSATAGGSGGITWTYKTADYTIVNEDGVVIDSAGTDRIITAPATIAAGHTWIISHLNTSGTSALVTFARNSHTLRYKGTDVTADVTIADGESLTIVCTSATNMEII